MIDMSSAMYSRNPKISDAWHEGFEDCILSEQRNIIKLYKEASSLEDFVELVFNEFGICKEELENLK